jgi:hypothetical protein
MLAYHVLYFVLCSYLPVNTAVCIYPFLFNRLIIVLFLLNLCRFYDISVVGTVVQLAVCPGLVASPITPHVAFR